MRPIYFFFGRLFFGVIPKKIVSSSQIFFVLFSSTSFIVWGLTFKSTILSELIFVYGMG